MKIHYFILFLFVSCNIFSQNILNDMINYKQLFEQTKSIYGNPIEIGMKSELMDRLFVVQSLDPEISKYCEDYLDLRDRLKKYINRNIWDIKNKSVLCVDLSVFKEYERNIVNLLFILNGDANGTTLDIFLLHNGIQNFYSNEFCVNNKITITKKESEYLNSGKCNFYELNKLRELNNSPLFKLSY